MTKCTRCQTDFEPPPPIELLGRKIHFHSGFCDPCAVIVDEIEMRRRYEEERQAIIDRNEARWAKVCPPLFQNTNPALLPQTPLQKALQWRYQHQGLVFHGDTGTGKTRIVFQLLRRLFEEGRSIRVLTASEFRRNYTAAAMANDAEEWVERLGQTDVLFLDDLGQTKMTEVSEEVLLDVLDLRTRNMKPTFFTTQYVGNDLLVQFNRPQCGQAVVRRLREFNDSIHVKKEKSSKIIEIPKGPEVFESHPDSGGPPYENEYSIRTSV